ncbi:uncharacterized protein B0T23DRAFT_165724 [Neurospora hispaniola]|uniref:RING-CH-type domain-containing protein n=1 Tax=Neurospora hispaniola TaxID=588809 RepID=A0AAJ0MQM6_9PEZI|nr:hypothetical protein B0T23DRAFT_165724 [Neurospora hispaniola]
MDFGSTNWSWPSGTDPNGHPNSSAQASSTHETPHSSSSGSSASKPSSQQQPKQRAYKPRTCRICLEVVQPTTEIDESFAARFTSRARVRYYSEDPELGRLISPCRCKGTQKYVHEGCLQQWRQASPLSDRNFWQCPTCRFEYRLERLRWGRWLTSTTGSVVLTGVVFILAVFVLGFVADPIINLWVDPWGSVVETIHDVISDVEAMRPVDDEPTTWSFHFLKGLLSLGLLGFLKTFIAMSPWQWFNIRSTVGGRRRGRDRVESVNWMLVMIGVLTFLVAAWKFVRHFSARVLEKARDRVVDIQEDEDADDEDDAVDDETRKDK